MRTRNQESADVLPPPHVLLKMMDESVRLLTFQQQLERESPTLGPFTGLSVNDTIKSCIVNGLSKKADKLKSDWKVPDKRCVTTPFPLLCSAIHCFHAELS